VAGAWHSIKTTDPTPNGETCLDYLDMIKAGWFNDWLDEIAKLEWFGAHL